MIDFSIYKRTNTFYGGTERKFGLDIDGFEYMIKFPKMNNFGGKRLNHICERYSEKKIYELIAQTPFLTETHKKFFKYILKQRFEKILLPAYKRLKEK